MRRLLAGVAVSAVLAGGLSAASLGPAAGTAHADHACTNSGVCNSLWCPGQHLPFSAHKGAALSPSEVNWDMNVCHWWFFDFTDHYGGEPVGAYGLKEGEPVAAWGW